MGKLKPLIKPLRWLALPLVLFGIIINIANINDWLTFRGKLTVEGIDAGSSFIRVRNQKGSSVEIFKSEFFKQVKEGDIIVVPLIGNARVIRNKTIIAYESKPSFMVIEQVLPFLLLLPFLVYVPNRSNAKLLEITALIIVILGYVALIGCINISGKTSM